MISHFISCCQSQRFVQSLLRKKYANFCLTNQDIRQHISNLIDLKEKQLNSKNQLEKETISLQISTYEKELDFFLKQFQTHQKQPYYLFRKNLIQLAYYTYYNGQYDLCLKYIQSAIVGDYENQYTGDLMKEIFLAELNGIQFRINYGGLEILLAEKSLIHWKNVIENHSKFYQQSKENKQIDINAFFENMENVHFHQYLESLIVVGKLFYRKGILDQAQLYYREAESKILEAIQYIFPTEQSEQKGKQETNTTENLEYIKYYKLQLNNFLANSLINQVKINILKKDFKECDELIKQIQEKNILNAQQDIQLNILKFDVEFYQGQDQSELEQLQQEIENEMKPQVNDANNKQLFEDYCQFRLKYNLDFQNQSQQLQQLQLIQNSIEKLIELNCHSIEQLILQNSYNEVYQFCIKQLSLLQQNELSEHFYWETLIFTILLSAYKINGIKSLKKNFEQISTSILPQISKIPEQNTIELFQNIIELESQTDKKQINQVLVQKLIEIQFEDKHLQFYKLLALEQCFEALNLKKELQDCYNDQINFFKNNQKYYQINIDEVIQKLQNMRV